MCAVCFVLMYEKPSCSPAFAGFLRILFWFVFKHAWKARVDESAKYDSLVSFLSNCLFLDSSNWSGGLEVVRCCFSFHTV